MDSPFTEVSVDRQSDAPAYSQLESQLATLIETGRLTVGDRLPSERLLASAVGVSRLTARAALAALARRGLVERGVGRRGTFVARPKLAYDLRDFAGFTEMARRQGLAAGARIRSLAELPAPEPIAIELQIDPGDSVYRLERLRFADAEPLTLEDTWIPATPFPGFLSHDMTGSVYAVMREAYAHPPVRAIERLEATVAEEHHAEALGVKTGDPLMLVVRVAYGTDDRPLEFARDHHRGDRSHFIVEVTNAFSSSGL